MNSEEYRSIEGGNEAACAGCGVGISDQYYLSALGGQWHMTCLRCSACHRQLDTTSTCYLNNGNFYCAYDFRRLFMSRDCAGCLEPIYPEDMVVRIRRDQDPALCTGTGSGNHVIYHARCFACARCDGGRPLSTGEHFGIQDGRVYCRAHYCESQLEQRRSTGVVWGPKGPCPVGPGRRTGMRGRPRKLRTAGRPKEHQSPKLCENISTPVDTEPSADQYSERLSSDVSDDAIHDDANSSNGGGGSSNGAWEETGSGNGTARRKRMRSSFKHHQLKIMKSYFQSNHNPDAKELREIALKTGLMTRVIQVWFQNARAKFRRNLSKQQQQQQVLGYVTDPIHSPQPPPGCPLQAPWHHRHPTDTSAPANAADDDDPLRHMTDPDFRFCRHYATDVISPYELASTQCRDCCSVEVNITGDSSSRVQRQFQQPYQ